MKIKIHFLVTAAISSSALFLVAIQPAFACTAASGSGVTDLCSLITFLISLINMIIPLLFGLALLAFIWGIIRYIFAAEPNKLNEARNYMVFGIIGMAVMLSVWSLAFLVKDSFFPNSPTFVTQSSSGS